MVEALLSSLALVFNWPVISWLMLGVVLGVWSGSIPGLGGIVALVVILPFTFGMEPLPGMALLLGLWAVTSTSDTIVSVMLGIPGTTASQATIMDGYPLAKKGQAERALGAAFTVSAVGGVVGRGSSTSTCSRQTLAGTSSRAPPRLRSSRETPLRRRPLRETATVRTWLPTGRGPCA